MTDAAHHARRPRKLVGVVLAAAVALLLPLSVVSTAQGAPPAPSPVTGAVFTFTSVTLPTTPGSAGLAYVVATEPFTISAAFSNAAGPVAFSDNKSTTVWLEYDGARLGDPVDVPAGEKSADFPALEIDDAASGVTLTLVADTKPRPQGFGSQVFDVLLEDEVTQPDARAAIGGDGGTGTECNPTPTARVCADLVPPSDGFKGGGLLSRGLCPSADQCRVDYIQALAPFDDTGNGLGLGTQPATLIMKCDKAECGGGAINKKELRVTLTIDPSSIFKGTFTAPPCPAKNTVGFILERDEDDDPQDIRAGNLPFCVDYVQSTRDNAGDTFLYLLFLVDAKVRFL